MRSLLFIQVRIVKNWLLEIKRKPAKLVMSIIAVAFFVGFVVMALIMPFDDAPPSDILWLKGIVFAYFLFMYGMTVKTGLATGGGFFAIEDVNFIFTSPIDSRTALIYGVFRTIKTVALTSLFIPFQAMWMNRSYRIGGSGILTILIGYILFAIVIQILAMYIYNVSGGRPRRKRWIKIIAAGVFLPMAVVFLIELSASGWEQSVPAMLASPVTSFTPLVGWASAGILAFINGEVLTGVLFFGLLAASGVLLVFLIYKSNPDYYEDVLVASETLFEQKRNLAEGKVDMEALSKKNVRLKGTGVGGAGASAIFYKHMRESFRANRFGLWGGGTLILLALSAVYAFAASRSPEAEVSGFPVILMQLIILMVIQMGRIGLGRGLKETYTHYIFMIPERPFVKMVWSNIEVTAKAGVESVLFFGTAGLIAGEDPLTALSAMVTYTVYSLMLVAVNFFALRFTGMKMNAGLLMVIYMYGTIILMMPGIAGLVAAILLFENWGLLMGLGIMTLWQAVMAAVFFYAARGILHHCDMPAVRSPG
jgi:hypothetical protein